MIAQKTMTVVRLWARVIAKAPVAYASRPSTYARLRPNRSPILLLIRMNAAETRASSAIAVCTALTVVSRSSTTAEIDTFISDVSTTSTNIAAASRSDRRRFPPFSDEPSMGALPPPNVPPRDSKQRHDDDDGQDHGPHKARPSLLAVFGEPSLRRSQLGDRKRPRLARE